MTAHAMNRLAISVGVLVLAACAAPRPSSTTPGPAGPADQVVAAEVEITRLESVLAALRADATPDCPRACVLVSNICALAGRICELAGSDAGLRPRCDDASARCARARASAAARCACEQTGR